jgi:hypothetical protein
MLNYIVATITKEHNLSFAGLSDHRIISNVYIIFRCIAAIQHHFPEKFQKII